MQNKEYEEGYQQAIADRRHGRERTEFPIPSRSYDYNRGYAQAAGINWPSRPAPTVKSSGQFASGPPKPKGSQLNTEWQPWKVHPPNERQSNLRDETTSLWPDHRVPGWVARR